MPDLVRIVSLGHTSPAFYDPSATLLQNAIAGSFFITITEYFTLLHVLN